jgi:hypothetical protein
MSIDRRQPARLALAAASALLLGTVAAQSAEAPTPVTSQSTASFALAVKDGETIVDITNVAYATTGTYVPGRPTDERLVLRTTVRSHEVIGDKGVDEKVTVEAWPLGTDLAAKPLYAVTLEGAGATVEDNGILVFDRQTEELAWWSVYGLGNGAPMFDSHVPLLSFSITGEVQTLRYAGLEVPPDDAADPRLDEPHVVGVVSYASAEKVIRQGLITCDDAERARALRSYWDTTRELTLVLTLVQGPPQAKKPDAKGWPDPTLTLKLTWSAEPPDAPHPVTALIPIAAGDDLDLAHARLPPGFHIVDWQRR